MAKEHNCGCRHVEHERHEVLRNVYGFRALAGAQSVRLDWTRDTLTAVIGAWAAERTGRMLGRPDHGAIVIDEIVAFWLVLLLLPPDLLAQALGFLAFRLFDILKPPPIRAVDRRFKSGVGVMADDLIAAFYALLLAAITVRVLG